MWGTRVGALDSEADPLSRMCMHTAVRSGSVEYSGYLDFVSGVCPSARLRVAPGFWCKDQDTLLRIELPCLRTSTGIGFRLATRLRHAGLALPRGPQGKRGCPAPTWQSRERIRGGRYGY